MITKKLIGFLSFLLILMPSAQAVTEQIIHDLNVAIEQSNKIKVLELLRAHDFTLEQLNNAYIKALLIYRKKDTFTARTSESLILPAAALSIMCGLVGFYSYLRANELISLSKKLGLEIASRRQKFELANQSEVERIRQSFKRTEPGISMLRKIGWSILGVRDVFNACHKLVQQREGDIDGAFNIMARFSESWVVTLINEQDRESIAACIIAAALAGGVCLCYRMQGALKKARAIVVAIEAKMNQNKNK